MHAAKQGDVVHDVEIGPTGPASGVRPKRLALTGTELQCDAGVMASEMLRDALAAAGLSQEAAANALGVSATRVQAKCDARRGDVPVTLGDVVRLSRASGKARHAARLLYEELGALLDDDTAATAMALPMLGMQFTVSALDLGSALQAVCATPTEGARAIAVKTIGSVSRVLALLRQALRVRHA